MEYELHRGDCLDIMPTLESESVDLTVTSPPYDNLREYGEDFNADAFDWRTIIAELYRVTKTGGVVVWVVADATIKGSETGTSFRQALWAMECGFWLFDTMIWRKTNPTPTDPRIGRYTPAWEYMFVFSKGKPQTSNLLRMKCKTAGVVRYSQNPSQRKVNGEFRLDRVAKRNGTSTKDTKIWDNVWDVPICADAESKDHPASYPESLARDHILSWSNPGDTVFDPMMGSGTTGKMAMIEGRRFIGCELDADYFAIAERRIADAARQARGEFRQVTDTQTHDDLPLFAGA